MNNAKRWPGNGRTSGMRCVIARAEPAGMTLLRLCDRALPSASAHRHQQKSPAQGGASEADNVT
ncbi:MAG TPA: hypothetical protein DCM39_13175 [Pantoea sp.]|nr:hypothetical protein [Pantoea sp.]